jgi:hypothetical protein
MGCCGRTSVSLACVACLVGCSSFGTEDAPPATDASSPDDGAAADASQDAGPKEPVFHGVSVFPQAKEKTVTLTRPPGTESGDLLWAVVYTHGSSGHVLPAGWQSDGNAQPGCGGGGIAQWSYHVAAATDPASWSWTRAYSENSWGLMLAYGGVDTTRVPEATQDTAKGVPPYETPAVVTAAPNALLVYTVITLNELTGWAAPPEMAQRTKNGAIIAFDGIQKAAGSSGPKRATAEGEICFAAKLAAFRAR